MPGPYPIPPPSNWTRSIRSVTYGNKLVFVYRTVGTGTFGEAEYVPYEVDASGNPIAIVPRPTLMPEVTWNTTVRSWFVAASEPPIQNVPRQRPDPPPVEPPVITPPVTPPRSEPPVIIPPEIPVINIGVGKIYTRFEEGDIIRDVDNITYGMWSGNVGNLTTFFTSSNQSQSSSRFHLDVYNGEPTLCTSRQQFEIAYGHYGGSGSYDFGGYDYLTSTRAIYGQYRNLCLDSGKKFKIGGSFTDSIYVINVKKGVAGDGIDEGNIELNLAHLSGSQFGNMNAHTGSNVKLAGTGQVLRLIDDSRVNSGSLYSGGVVYNVVSGSLEQGVYNSTNPIKVGLLYPNLGVMILDGNKLDTYASFLTTQGTEVSGANEVKMFTAISGAAQYTDASGDVLGFQSRKTKKKYTTFYFARVKHYDYNYTNNPTFMTGSEGLIHPDFRDNTRTYITTVGLYNQKRELLAVGKISKALLKNCVTEALLEVKLIY